MESEYASVGLVTFLFAIFCAYWAQTTNRSAWLWFFMGWLFAPITAIVLLSKSRHDLPSEEPRSEDSPRLSHTARGSQTQKGRPKESGWTSHPAAGGIGNIGTHSDSVDSALAGVPFQPQHPVRCPPCECS
jgi:hypothetical protein